MSKGRTAHRAGRPKGWAAPALDQGGGGRRGALTLATVRPESKGVQMGPGEEWAVGQDGRGRMVARAEGDALRGWRVPLRGSPFCLYTHNSETDPIHELQIRGFLPPKCVKCRF